ncbi:PepSY domain-containing protein [Paraburkholderia sp. J69-1]
MLYALHIGRFADLPTRALYFMLGLAGTAMVATGIEP